MLVTQAATSVPGDGIREITDLNPNSSSGLTGVNNVLL